MSDRVQTRPSRENRSVKVSRRRAGAQGGETRAGAASRLQKAPRRKAARTRGPAAVSAHIRVFGVALSQNARKSIRQKLDRKFRKFAGPIERMSVRLMDVNGPRGGVDHLCRIKVVLRNLPSVVYEKQDVSPDMAFGGALVGAEQAVRRALQRRRSKPIRKRPRVALVPKTKSNKES